jgi:signal transduction histidine kinase
MVQGKTFQTQAESSIITTVRLNLSLSQKGLILVVGLLLLETVFVGTLAQMLNQAEREAAVESHSKEIVGHTNKIFQLAYDAGTAAANYQTANGGAAAAQRFHTDVAQLPAEVAALRDLVHYDPHDLQTVQRIDHNLAKLTKIVALLMDTAEGGAVEQAAALAQESKDVYTQVKQALFDDLNQMMHDQEKIIAESPAAQSRSRHNQQKALVVGFIFNICAAIAFALFFLRGITDRIDILSKNTDRLARNAPLSPRMAGGDEIARLDHVFHDMADALAEAARLKQEFVAMVSHDLRTPLTSINGFLVLLEHGVYGELPAKAVDGTNMAIRSINRLILLINDLLDMEKMEAGKLEMTFKQTALEPIIQRTMESLKNFAEQHEVALLNASPSNLEVFADADRLVQVGVNLVSNAIKFSPKGGTVTISAEPITDFIVVRVKDQGPGIPPQYVDAIFERFRQLPASEGANKGGTGLGLAICKAIVEQHGGKIGVDTEESKGSTFWFLVPMREKAK